MKRHLMTAFLVVCVALFVVVGCAFAQEEEVELTPQELLEAQETAQRFVGRMQQTRDVAALFSELFLPGFMSHLESIETATPALYARLTRTERRRLFVAWNNLAYLSSVTIISGHDDMDVIGGEEKANAKMLLPLSIALKLRRALRHGYETELKSYRQFRSVLPALELALAEARAYLTKRGLEQTAEFQRELASSEAMGDGINYRVRAYVGGMNVKDCGPLTGFPKGQKFFRVEIPLLIGVILTKDDERMKIVNITFVDGD